MRGSGTSAPKALVRSASSAHRPPSPTPSITPPASACATCRSRQPSFSPETVSPALASPAVPTTLAVVLSSAASDRRLRQQQWKASACVLSLKLPTTHALLAEAAATAHSLLLVPPGLGLATRVHVRPFQCKMRVSLSVVLLE